MNKKAIIFDCGYLAHRSIFAWGSQKKKLLEQGIDKDPLMASYGYLNTVYSTLKRIGVSPEDKVLFAKDGFNSFRRAFLVEYKAQRKAFRESHEQIDWKLQYSLINKLEKQLHTSTNWNFVQLNEMFNFADLCLTEDGDRLNIESHDIDMATEYGIEADDIMAIVPKYLPDHEVVLVTIDKDINQLYYFKNCKVFNPNLKSPTNKAKKGYYEIVDDPLDIIAKKVRSGDKSDNILVDKHSDTERDVEVRKFIIDMLHMPDFVEKPIITALDNLDWNKKVQYDRLPFPNSLGQKFDSIYDKKNIRSWEESVTRHITKELGKMEKNSVKTPEELYEKNEKYKGLKDRLDECKKEKVKV